ncbi:MAG: TetR/AcrR family transcriptional regulator [Bacillaceae bacterium]|nr:TetR/AcrR family transcriptional regulator [Bacillaceae bacterium]
MPEQPYFKLTTEKQWLIYTESLREFKDYGYDAASTNRIVKRTGISKGSLFKYFKTKEDLFIFVCEKSARMLLDHLNIQPEGAFFERVKKTLLSEIAFYKKYPDVYQLFRQITGNPGHPVYQNVIRFYQDISDNILQDLFGSLPGNRQETDQKKRLDIWSWILEGMKKDVLHHAVSHNLDATRLSRELDDYFLILKPLLEAKGTGGAP